MSHVESRPPFFIVGADRSGTTMLRLILDRAPDGPATPPETMFITDFLPAWREGGLDDHDRAVEFTRRVWAHPRVRMWKLEGEPAIPPTGLPHEEAFRWAVSEPYRAYMRTEGKSWWADKTPPFIDYVPQLREMFPGAKFIELVRDGRDVALSITGLPFGDNNTWHAGKRWASCIRQGELWREQWPDEVLLVKYEDLVTDPEPQIERVCEFLDLAFDTDMMAVEKSDSSKLVSHQAGWFTNLWGGINTNAMDKWRRVMSEQEQARFLDAAGPELALHGYEDAGISPAAPSRAQRRWLGVTNFLARLKNFAYLRLYQERGAELRWIVARRLPGRS